jgi:hypothetical protein
LLLTPHWANAQAVERETFAPVDVTRLLLVSPDGSKVVGSTDLRGDELCVYSVPEAEEITCADLHARQISLNLEDIAWSPDSSTVVFAERPFVTFIDGDLWTMDAETGELTNVTDDNFEGGLPIFRDEDMTGPIYADVNPRVSPDGTRIAFSRTMFDGESDGKPSELWLLDFSTGESHRIARVSDGEPGLLYFNLAWSPDGATVYASLFHADVKNPENGVWAFDLSTGEKEQIAGATADFEGAAPAVMAVSPLGDALTVYYPAVLYNYAAREPGFGLLSLETGEIEPIHAPESLGSDEIPANVLAPGFTPDGSSLMYLARGTTGTEGALVLRDLETGDEHIFELSNDAEPLVNAYRDGMILSDEGTVLVLTSLNAGELVEIDNPSLLERPDVPLVPVSTPAASGEETREITGSYVQLHAAPTTDAPVVFVFSAGDQVEVIGEPVEIDGETWVPVRDPASGTIGYVLESELGS